MSIDSSILIAGQPVLSLIEGLESVGIDVIEGKHVRLMPKVTKVGDPT